MGWDDLPRFELDLSEALRTFDWPRVDQLCQHLVARLRGESGPPPQDRASSILYRLRRKRRYEAMALVADAFLESGLGVPRVRLQYAQALIERGFLAPAELMVRSIAATAAPSSFEDVEMRGLLGRIGKQRYIAAHNPAQGRYRVQLEQAMSEYLGAYRLDPAANYWHGINAVAVIRRALRDGVALANAPDPDAIARDVLAAAAALAPAEQIAPFVLATRLEAQVALGDQEQAEHAAADYAASDAADAFELASTLRQLVEVWGLGDGSRLVAMLRMALLRREGGGIRLSEEAARADLRQVDAMRTEPGLEKVFGQDGFRTLEWYRTGLERCRAIARIETRGGRGMGTGWLIDGPTFFTGRPAGEVLLLTNAHVITPGGSTRSAPLSPAGARANFRLSETVCDLGEVVWTSPVPKLDATIVTLKSEPPPGVAGLAPAAAPLTMPDGQGRAPRLYIIGYPGGRDLEFSLQDNVLLGCSDRLVHYRTPTEGGSSGSPVFDEEEWGVVALHHAGRSNMPRLNGDGTYEANEGIRIDAIMQATRSA
jgi:hypothetical protein